MLETFLVHWGYLAVGVGTLLEGEAVLLAAGAMAHRGLLSLPLVIAAAFVGSVLGDQAWFLVGRRFGREFLLRRPALAAHAAVVQRWVASFGTLFVLGFRFMYGLRTVTPVVLGATGYPGLRFVVLNMVSAALWAAAVGAAGFGLGAGVANLMGHATRVEEALLAAATIAALVWWIMRRRLRKAEARPAPPGARLQHDKPAL